MSTFGNSHLKEPRGFWRVGRATPSWNDPNHFVQVQSGTWADASSDMAQKGSDFLPHPPEPDSAELQNGQPMDATAPCNGWDSRASAVAMAPRACIAQCSSWHVKRSRATARDRSEKAVPACRSRESSSIERASALFFALGLAVRVLNHSMWGLGNECMLRSLPSIPPGRRIPRPCCP